MCTLSGSGTNLQALIDSQKSQDEFQITLVISNKKQAFGLDRAKNAGIKTLYVPYFKSSQSRKEYDISLVNNILQSKPQPNLIVCVGWMHILSKAFLTPFSEISIPIINLHPALPYQFNGVNAIERAWASFRNGLINETGVMVHQVVERVDEGDVIVVEKIQIQKEDGLNGLRNKIHNMEHRLIVAAVKKILLGKLN